MKKISLFIVIFALISPQAKSQVMVIDPQSITKQAQEFTRTAQRWTQQVQQYQNMFTNAQNQLSSISGVTNIQQMINQANSFLNNLDDISSVLQNPSNLLQTGFSGLPPDVRNIYQNYGLNNICINQSGNAKNLCEGQIALAALKQQRNEMQLQTLKNRVTTINQIAQNMASATTLKQATDYANAIKVQETLLNADKTIMELENRQDQQQRDLINLQQTNDFRKTLEDARRFANPTGKWN